MIYRKKDGRKIYGLLSVTPVKDENANVVESLSIVVDITPRKQAEENLHLLSLAIEQSSEVFIVTDPEGKILYTNPAFKKITGYSSKEASGQYPLILKSGKQDEAFYRDLWNTISGGKVWRGRIINRKKNGSLYTEEATIFPVLDPGGRIKNYVKIARDITDHLNLENQFQQAQKMEAIGRLAGSIAHDFNNLLTAINNNAQLARQELINGDPMAEYLEEIISCGEKAAALTQQLLTFSRKRIVSSEVVNLNNVIKDMNRLIGRLLKENIELTVILDPEISNIKINSGQIEQVIMNMIVNAADAMPDGGKLLIETGTKKLDNDYQLTHLFPEPGNYVTLSITDTGVGMDEKTKMKVFEPFFTTKEKGTGLGLSTAYGIVKQAGGHITLYSEPKTGTTFRLYFPISAEEVTSAEKKPIVPESLLKSSGIILIVEDEEYIRKVMKKAFLKSGYEVFLASSCNEALLLCEKENLIPDLLLTDIVLPDMDGFELSAQIKKKNPKLKTLFMSGYEENVIPHKDRLTGEFNFIGKPFNISDLLNKVKEVLLQ